MEDNDLLKRVAKLGFDLFAAQRDENAGKTLADVVRSRDLRLWEGFPMLLFNCFEGSFYKYEDVQKYLKKGEEGETLSELVAMSLALYRELDLKFAWDDEVFTVLLAAGQKKYNEYVGNLKENKDLKVGGQVMNVERLKNTFQLYFKKRKPELKALLDMKEEFDLEFALAQVFSPKQKELFFKRLKGEKMTKTEREYFYRVVKKKVLALANSELHRLSMGLVYK